MDNNYHKDVFTGDIGQIAKIDYASSSFTHWN